MVPCCISSGVLQILLPTVNLLTHYQAVNRLEKAKVIRPYAPLFGSSRASALLHTFSRKHSVRRNSGLYKLGHGEKSVIWYWEFDVQRRYFHQFKTIDYAAAVEFYAANKFTLWEEKKGRSFRRQLGRCWKGDFHEHAAETDVQGQDDGQNVWEDEGNSKDNDDQQDNEERESGYLLAPKKGIIILLLSYLLQGHRHLLAGRYGLKKLCFSSIDSSIFQSCVSLVNRVNICDIFISFLLFLPVQFWFTAFFLLCMQ